MPRQSIDFDTVIKIGLALPGVEDGTTYGSPALKVGGKMFACLAVHRSAEPNTLAIRVDFDRRTELIAVDPETYYVTDHYVNYPAVLVRLSHVHRDALCDLLAMSRRFVAGRGSSRSSASSRARSRGGGSTRVSSLRRRK